MSNFSEKEYTNFLINLYKQQGYFEYTNDYLKIINEVSKIEESYMRDILPEDMHFDTIQYQNYLKNNILEILKKLIKQYIELLINNGNNNHH
uniref:Uncharacterized protein n=1 Tax=Moumouvirus sp. 'Monve' TaxID=1128131 RepID=H2EEJ3_9VIRU|nr:hypothetical protein mv_L611 [Moumouvirus Monve]